MVAATTLLTGLRFGESPRWYDGRLWVSDFYDRHVLAVDVDSGRREVVARVPGQPSGLGWLPDGRLLVVSMTDRRLLRREPDGRLMEHADLSPVAVGHANDLLVDDGGGAYVGCFGFDLPGFVAEHGWRALQPPRLGCPPAPLARIDPDGTVRTAAGGLRFPNGMAWLDGGRTLVVAETFGYRLTAYDVGPRGELAAPRVWADLGDCPPDGICADGDGGIWVAHAAAPLALQVAEGGAVLARVETSQPVFAVALGGADAATLFCVTAPSSLPSRVAERRDGRVEMASVR